MPESKPVEHIFLRFAPLNNKIEMSWLKLLLTVLAILVHLHRFNSQDVYVYGADTIPLGGSLSGNQTIISKNGTFELGFLSPTGTNNWYVGIWYAQIPEKTIIWVANREIPLRNMPGVLKLSTDGNLRLFDLDGRSIWSSDNMVEASRARMLDSGNFVLVGAHDTSVFVWESFKHPTDTWLPGIKQWKGLQLTSWRSSWDPAPGYFSFGMDPSPQSKQILLLYNESITYWYSGQWTGDHFSDLPELVDQKMVSLSFVTVSPLKSYLIFTLNPQIASAKARFVLDKSGQLRMYFWVQEIGWNLVWSAPADGCNVYGVCGDYGACNSNNMQFCSCLQGFITKNNRAWNSQQWWASGCVRRDPLQCTVNGSTDGFLQVTDKFLSNEQSVSYPQEVMLEGCQAACLNNCSCTAFAITGSSPPVCQLWFGELLNVRDSSDNSSVYIRLAASDFGEPSSMRARRIREIYISVAAIAFFIAVLALVFAAWRLRRSNLQPQKLVEDDTPANVDLHLQMSMQFFPTWAAAQLESGNIVGIVDERIAHIVDIEEVRRTFVVGRLCIKEDENDRPSMSQVLQMLEGTMRSEIV
ncbi:hypothetical protein SUGI_0662510 [Cryptomeria japonica]|nr:hypothetical protein SUGI_0662510 [Cryptomeria japonica]